MIEPIFYKPELHPKTWGSELWICNNNEFCGKLLNFKEGAKFSFHFHINKREVFYVFQGDLELEYFDLTDATRKVKTISAGNVIEIPRNCPHKLTSLSRSLIIEFSTHHEESDSYRIEKGDSQK